MAVAIYSEVFLQHDTGWGHPESAERLRVAVAALRAALPELEWQEPTPRPDLRTWLQTAHGETYLQRLAALSAQGGGYWDADTPVAPGSWQAAQTAVAAWLTAVDRAIAGEPALALVRPPGHHARPHTAMGFCLLANAAIAARYALSLPGIERVGILDWDVHHGNGTQEIVENDARIAFCSLHQWPHYPFTGRAQDTGPHGNVLNLPLPPGTDRPTYRALFQDKVLPFFQAFRPHVLLVSAGYDSLAGDPLGGLLLEPRDYGDLVHLVRSLGCPIALGLEGGYDPQRTAAALVATLAALSAPWSVPSEP